MRFGRILLVLAGLILLAVLVYQIPAVQDHLLWRIELARAYLGGVVNPAGELPTSVPMVTEGVVIVPTPTFTPQPSPTQTAQTTVASPTVNASPTPLPESISLPAPEYEQQDINNCGPAALSLYLRYYGWDGDQFSISEELRSDRRDRNINVEELLYYTRSYVGWLESTFRVGGTTELIKEFLAAGIPVMTEETFYFEEPYWPDDDLWAGHYLLITGYDDASGTFTVQDTFYGPDKLVSYTQVDELWQPFNRVYMLIYLPEQEETVKAILGEHWDVEYNRQAALDTAQAEIDADPENALAWFNLGTNLVYFERYAEAADAYDEARNLGLPQRMLRYQFGPFFAYFHSGRTEDLLALTEYALKITYNSEEAFLWTGWGLYRQGDSAGAIDYFRQAYEANNTSVDAQYALEFMGASP